MSRPVTPARNRSRLTRAVLGLIALALSVVLPADPAKAEKLTLLLDLEAGLGEESLLLGHDQGRMVRVQEPVEQKGELFGPGRTRRQQDP